MSAVVAVLRNGEPHCVDEITKARDTPQIIDIINRRGSSNMHTDKSNIRLLIQNNLLPYVRFEIFISMPL